MEDKKSFVLYANYIKHISKLTDEEAGQLFKALFRYVESGELSELSDRADMAFSFIAEQMGRDLEKWEKTRQKRIEAGRKGGKQNQANQANATFAKQSQANQAVNVDVNVNDNVNVNVNDINIIDNIKGGTGGKDKLSPTSPKSKTTKFVKPPIEEITAYCHERNNNVDANKFYDYYESNGWHVGKNPMKDWKAAIRTWERKENYGTGNANSTNGTTAGTSWGEVI